MYQGKFETIYRATHDGIPVIHAVLVIRPEYIISQKVAVYVDDSYYILL